MNESEEIYENTLRLLNGEFGTDFPYIASFDTRNVDIAKIVLPVLASVVNKITDPDKRHDVYARFHTPLAYPYFNEVLRWFESEPEPELQGTLTQDVELLVRPRDAERVWKLCNRYRPFHYMLLAKLSKFKSVGLEVTDAAVKDLVAGKVPDWELAFVYKIRDPRIEEWFANLPDKEREKALGRTQHRRSSRDSTQTVVLSRRGPDYRKELTSAEVTLEEGPEFLKDVAQQFNIVLPESFADLSFLNSLALDKWFTAPVKTTSGADVKIWLRLEDFDTVEIWITADNLQVGGTEAGTLV